MAKDHFEIHAYVQDKVDWNFNILFDDQPQIADMLARYARLLARPDLYPPVPPEWLHMTILRVGFTTDFTAAEMEAVTQLLEPRLAAMQLPEFTLGPAWLYKGYPLLHITPEEPLDQIFQEVLLALRQVAGEERLPNPVDRPATKLIPHVSLAYTRNDTDEDEIEQILADNPIPPVTFQLHRISLIKQKPAHGHYEWEVIKNIPINA